MAEKRQIEFDIMKGIGIILVMSSHYYGYTNFALNNIITSFHMPMFFFIAGYFSKPCWLNGFSIVKKYFKRLYWPFAITQALIALWAVVLYNFDNGNFNDAVSNGLSILWADVYGPNTKYGSLTIGAIWFLMALLVSKILLIPLSHTGIYGIPISLLIAYLTIRLHAIFPYSIWCISLAITALPFVYVGWFAKSHKIPNWTTAMSIVIWILAILYSQIDMYGFIWKNYLIDVIGAGGGTYLIFLFSRHIISHIPCMQNIFRVLGLYSLAILCAHSLEMAAHLNNHFCAIVHVSDIVWLKQVSRYLLTFGIAYFLVKAPIFKIFF